MSAAAAIPVSEAAILGRLIRPEEDDLSPEAARSILKLDFDAHDHARMHELISKAQQGSLSPADEAELSSYRGVGRLLDILRSKARCSQRARSTCEYCQLPQSLSSTPFEIDHIIARKHGGPTESSNLALACFYCVAKTSIGRATVTVLGINVHDAVAVRQALIEEGVFPTPLPKSRK
jgi:HNH endonuclease